ncbi:MAG: hypothetical protein COB15_01430 [Flavobacteriales bacterium]|nr:MAG: hypothetical protein COB15_01430 [Flavobacteriales bacterium]
MKLVDIEIEDYKSIKKLDWKLSNGLTCLVGQNESGKSNIIEILDYLKFANLDELSTEIHTNRSSDRYVEQELPFIKLKFNLNNVSRKLLREQLDPYNADKDVLNEIKDLTHFTIQTTPNEKLDEKIYFEDKTHSYGIDYFVPNAGHLPAALEIIENIQTKVVKLEEDYIDQFELTLDQLIANSVPDSGLVKLMKLAGVSDFTKLSKDPKRLAIYLKRISKNLNTKFTRKYYSQDDSVQLNVVHHSGKVSLEIFDNTDTEYDIHERSDGFKYFFGLLIEVASLSNDSSDIIFLLDEPGSKLHPSGQRDLLKYLEELSEKFRVIYTTHSPFLINRLYPNRVKVIERSKAQGTTFKHKGFSKNWHPMRSALGLNLSDSFYYSEKALIVEGPEDIIYLGSLINLFNDKEEIKVNTDIFSFIDAGGEGNLPAMIQIMIEEERPIMVLMDSDSEKTYNKIEKKRKTLKSGQLVLNQINDFKNDSISIEDLLPKDLLKKAINAYAKELVEDHSLILVEGKSSELKGKLSENSVYKNSIAPFIKDNFTNPSKEKSDWEKEKVPISKVGIARHFEKELFKEDYLVLKTDLVNCLKLVKTVIQKLKLKD